MFVYVVTYEWQTDYEDHGSLIKYVCASQEIAEEKVKYCFERDEELGVDSADEYAHGTYVIHKIKLEGA